MQWVFSSARGSVIGSVNFGWWGWGGGGRGATYIGTACHWLTRRGGWRSSSQFFFFNFLPLFFATAMNCTGGATLRIACVLVVAMRHLHFCHSVSQLARLSQWLFWHSLNVRSWRHAFLTATLSSAIFSSFFGFICTEWAWITSSISLEIAI